MPPKRNLKQSPSEDLHPLDEGEKREDVALHENSPASSTLSTGTEGSETGFGMGQLFKYLVDSQEKAKEKEKEERLEKERKEREEKEERERREERRAREEREWRERMEKREEESRLEREKREEERRVNEAKERAAQGVYWQELLKQQEEARSKEREQDKRLRLEEEAAKAEARLRDSEALTGQQREIRLNNEEAHERQVVGETYAALLARLPKFYGKQAPNAFLQALEKQLVDNEISAAKWLSALENSLQGLALTNYWNLIAPEERGDYESAKEALLRCMEMVVISRLEQVANPRKGKDEGVAEMAEESVQHVDSFLKSGDDKADVRFKWILTRTLAKCRGECAEAVWKQAPTKVSTMIQCIREWEQKHGSSGKFGQRKFFSQGEKKFDAQGSQVNKEDNTWKVSTGVQIKSERDLTPKAIGGKSESIRCYKCGKLGHIERNCPKVTIKRIKKTSNEGCIYTEGKVAGKTMRQ